MHDREHQPQPAHLVPLWIGFLGPPAAWALQLGVGYLLITIACTTGIPNPILWLLLVSLAALLIDVAAGVLAWRTWRKTGIGMDTDLGGAAGRSGYMALAGVVLSVVFAFAILLGAFSSLLLEPCGG